MPRISLRTAFPFLAAGLTTLAGLLPAKQARAHSPYLVVPAADVAEATAAYKYANMTAAEALAELDRRKVPYVTADPIDGVVAPVRLAGKLHGVHIHSSIPESQRATSIYEVLDARLALALDDFARILSRHDVEEVVHYSLYRPNVPREDHGVKHEAKDAGSAAKAKGAAAGSNEAKDAGSAAKAKGAAAGSKASAPAPASKATSAKSKSGAPVSALPQLPAGKLSSPAPKGEGRAGHGAKQKTPGAGVADKATASTGPGGKAPAAKTPAATKPGVVKASGKAPGVKSGATVGAGTKGGAVAQKSAAPARARATTATTKTKVAPGPRGGAPVAMAAKGDAKGGAKVEAGREAASNGAKAPATRQTWAAPGTRHPAGLAIDVAMLKKRDGTWLSVASHFRGRIGDKTCGDGVRTADTPEARELRSIVCESNDLGVFTYVLTPNYDAAHFDHFHMEIRPQVKWFLYQ